MSRLYKSIVFILSLSLLTIAVYFVFKYAMLETIKKFNYSMAVSESNAISNSLTHKLKTIENMNLNWANWDDTYKYIQDSNKEYAEDNLIDKALEDANLNMILFFDTSGRLIFKKTYWAQGVGGAVVPAEVLTYTTDNKTLDIKNIVLSGKLQSGFIYTTNGTFVFSVSPILKSDGTGPAKGALMVARYLNESDEIELKESTGMNIKFVDPTKFESYYPHIKMSYLSSGPYIAQTEEPGIATYSLFKDYAQNPALVIRLQHPMLGREFGLKLTIILTGIAIATSTIFWFILSALYTPRKPKPKPSHRPD